MSDFDYIIIRKNESGSFDIHVDTRFADRLGPDEALGVLAALIKTDKCLQRLRTPEQHTAWSKALQNIKNNQVSENGE